MDDPLLRFWFRFVYPELSYLRQASPSQGYQTVSAPHLDAYYGHCFERLCREALAAIYGNERIPTRFEIGSYWDKAVQIDVVGHRSDGRIDLGECKWGKELSAPALVREIERKRKLYPNPSGSTLRPMVFTRFPMGTIPEDVMHYSLEDLYDERGERNSKLDVR